MLGDSLSSAYGIPRQQGWVALLQARLDQWRTNHHAPGVAAAVRLPDGDELFFEVWRGDRDHAAPVEVSAGARYTVILGRSAASSPTARRSPLNGCNTNFRGFAPGKSRSPRNAEQTFALHALTNPGKLLVTLSGKAGTGKTLLALASSLELRKRYRQIYLARPVVPLSNRDMGYLPGDIQSKLDPYMQPLWDNLAVISRDD